MFSFGTRVRGESATRLHAGPFRQRTLVSGIRWLSFARPGSIRATQGRIVGFSKQEKEDMTTGTNTTTTAREQRGEEHAFVQGVHGVRYQVKDVARSVAFYTTHLGFTVGRQQLPAFANVSLGDAHLLLSGPRASGSRRMPNGQQQEPGGWNRVVLRVADLPGFIETLRTAGVHFRNDLETGPGGKQIQIEDPDGNPIELFEPAR
jgi:glyoxylase I family protein